MTRLVIVLGDSFHNCLTIVWVISRFENHLTVLWAFWVLWDYHAHVSSLYAYGEELRLGSSTHSKLRIANTVHDDDDFITLFLARTRRANHVSTKYRCHTIDVPQCIVAPTVPLPDDTYTSGQTYGILFSNASESCFSLSDWNGIALPTFETSVAEGMATM